MLHEGSSDSASVKHRIDEQATYFLVDQGNESCDAAVGVPDPCLGRGEVYLLDVPSFERQELICKKWMTHGRGISPHRQYRSKILWPVLSNHGPRGMQVATSPMARRGSPCLCRLSPGPSGSYPRRPPWTQPRQSIAAVVSANVQRLPARPVGRMGSSGDTIKTASLGTARGTVQPPLAGSQLPRKPRPAEAYASPSRCCEGRGRPCRRRPDPQLAPRAVLPGANVVSAGVVSSAAGRTNVNASQVTGLA